MPTIIRLRDLKKKKEPNKNRSAKYYNSKSWQTIRNRYIRDYPLCERCLANGKTVPAEHIHHLVPFLTGITEEERWKLLTDVDNLQALCAKCHKEIHNMMHEHYD